MAKLAQRVQLQKRVFSSEEMEQFSPHHVNLEALQAGDKSCSVAPKMGYWFVGCYVDKDPDKMRRYYSGDKAMTPQACFDHCQWSHGQGVNFFFLKNGRDCSCARYYHKGGMGSPDGCTMQCEGDSSKFCGGKTKESVYQMHDCNAAAYKPMDPSEGRKYSIDQTKNGIEFFSGEEMVTPIEPTLMLAQGPNGTSMLQARRVGDTALAWSQDLTKGLRVAIFDPHSGATRETHVFFIEGYDVNKPGDSSNALAIAKAEAKKFSEFVRHEPEGEDVVSVAGVPALFQSRLVGWWEDVKQGLHNLGCPVIEQANAEGFGYSAVCSGRADGAQSDEVIAGGHVAATPILGVSTQVEAWYMIDCQMTAWANDGECSLTCGGGQQYQTREIFIDVAHGGAKCPEDFDRYIPCNLDPCPVDCGYSEWTPWQACSADCGPGTHIKERQVTNTPLHGGVACDETQGNLEREQACQDKFCPIHAEWEEWSEWSTCSEMCNAGINTRSRDRAVVAQHGGRDIEGPFEEERGCFLKPCPINCEITEWADEGMCSLTCGEGLQKQTRRITVAAQHGGAECPTDLEQHLPCNPEPCPVDCVMSDWMDDSGCSLTCGGGKRNQYRFVRVAPQHGGVPCPRTEEQFIDCNSDPCPVDAVLSTWSGWAPCDHDCGPGKTTRSRFEEVVAQHGGYEALGPREQTKDCQLIPCPVDCEWGDFEEWSECDEACGPGVQDRSREVAVHNQWNGRACEGPHYEERTCEKVPCPVECVVSEWADEGVCDKQCGGGFQLQVREIESDAQHGGECPENMSRSVECNTHPCPVKCEMSNWANNGDCSVTCGGGEIKQDRYVIQPAQYGAQACPVDLDQMVACNDQPCPVDCVWSIWAGWSPCSTACGPGISTRTRRITTPVAYGGVACVGVDYEETECQAKECPIDCEFADWGEWSGCDEKCGPGERFRERTEAVVAEHGGAACLGDYNAEEVCEVVPCPIDCQITQWAAEGDCSLTCGSGLQNYARQILVHGAHDGVACPTDMTKQELCNTQSCPIDCVLSDWLPDGDCTTTCGGGLQKEVKDVTTAPAYGGAVCDQPQQRHVACNTEACPIDCVWAAWGGWTMCDAACGEGKHSRHRGKWTEEEHGGVACAGPGSEERLCQLIPCPINCEWEDWGSWSVCDEECGPGEKTRMRGVAVHRQYGGAVCEGKDLEETECEDKPCPVECEMSEWGVTSGCDATCGGGQMVEEREIHVNGQHGADACPSDLIRTVACNDNPCPVDCLLTGWNDDGSCSQSCGGGHLHQLKQVLVEPAYGGDSCHPEQERWVDCNEHACPVDCAWGTWTGWSPCSAACGTGTSERTRVHEVTVAHGGIPCSGGAREAEECTSVPCPIDGVWGDWGDWGSCDEQCGFGEHFRSRDAAVEMSYGGKPLEGPASEYTACKIKECPVDCEVSNWYTVGECSVSCGGGLISVKRDVSQEALHDGAGCPADLEREDTCNTAPCPVDCELSEFAEVSGCSVTCGGGVVTEKRSILVPPANNGVTCDAPLQRDVACNEDPCPIDCEWGQWTGFDSCSQACGEGTQSRSRGTVTESEHSGAECEGEGAEERGCELVSCPVDCAWGDWGEWTGCSEPCGPGETSRARQYHTPAEFGGAPCEGSFVEVDECEAEKCPVDCEVSDWADAKDAACSVTCGGGSITQERKVTQPAQFNGDKCPTNLARTVNCNDDACPIDCEMSEWVEDGSCSVTCGEGEIKEKRAVLTQPAHGGKACPVDADGDVHLARMVACAKDPCPVDCVWGAWTGWEECSTSCAAGERGRSRVEEVSAAHGGSDCVGAGAEKEVCNDFECPIDCAWADWTPWTECSEACGVGQQTRNRFESQSAQFGGASCDGLGAATQDCELKPCPIDCEVTKWETAADAVCTASCGGGELSEVRTIALAAAHGGAACPESLARSVPCNEDPCPVNCELDEWRGEGLCSKSCGGGEKKMVRAVSTAAAFGGEACPAADSGDRLRHDACNEHACPVDCAVSEWSGWNECSESCGPGTSARTRGVTTEAAHGGAACPADLEESKDCQLVECPIDCVYGEWAEFAPCDAECGDGVEKRSRAVKTEAQFGGAQCTDPATESQACKLKECPVDCELGEWGADGDCSATCGGGVQKEKRDVQTDKAHGGAECPADRTRELACNTDACPIDCVVTDWVEDASCTASCGGGTRTMVRSVTTQAANGGKECPSDLSKDEECGADPCPVNCEMAVWSSWGECSKSCGEGRTKRTRSVATKAEHGGAACPEDLESTMACSDGECPVDCVMAAWGAWGECSVSCGEQGTQSRERTVDAQPYHGGKACDALAEVRDCPSIGPCPVDCVSDGWEDVTECTRSCGGGEKTQQLKVTTEPAHGGLSCGATERADICNPAACPVDCVVSDWEHDGTCSRGCGGGVQHKRRYVTTAAAHGGAACPAEADLTFSEECNTQTCPASSIGESGAQALSMKGGGGSATVVLNTNFASPPVVVVGPVPGRAAGLEATSVLASVGKRSAMLDAAAVALQVPACKCTGGPSGQVPMPTEQEMQFPALYGKACNAWPARDPAAALAQASGDMEPIYLGDRYGYNPVTQTRFYIGGLVPDSSLVVGKPITFPKGVNLADMDEEGDAVFPTNGVSWCYVSAGCPSAVSDGWASWASCEAGDDTTPAAWDTEATPGFPEVTECPVKYAGALGKLPMLTRKAWTPDTDVCVGADEDNECHDGSSLGGATMGFVSQYQLTDDMVLLQRAYNADAKDTCVFPAGKQAAFCKAAGSYGSATDLGYAFTAEQPGTVTAEFKTSAARQDSCMGVPGSQKDDCGADAVVVGTVYLLDQLYADSWGRCGSASGSVDKWYFELKASVSGESSDADPNFEQVAWAALAEGVYETSDGTKFQAGISFVPAGSEFHTVQFHEAFGSEAPVVVANVLATEGVPNLKMREADADAFYVQQQEGDLTVHWLAIEATDGYLSSYPFSAGVVDNVDPEGVTIEWEANQFFQTPLVLASVATSRDEAAKAELRTTSNTVEEVTFVLEGSQTAEKVGYVIYNGQSKAGSIFNAKPLLAMTYAFVVGGWEACGNPGEDPRAGTRTRSVECKGTNDRVYEAAFCGAAPSAEEACCVPKVEADFAAGACGAQDDGCGGAVALAECSYEYETTEWSECFLGAAAFGAGSKSRTSACVRSDGASVDSMLCGDPPATSEACCVAATAAAFEGKNCGVAADSCGGEVELGECSHTCVANVCEQWTMSAETPSASLQRGTWGDVEQCADGHSAVGAKVKVQAFQGSNALVRKYPKEGVKHFTCTGVELASFANATKDGCAAKCDEQEDCTAFVLRDAACELYSTCEIEQGEGAEAFKALLAEDDTGVNAVELICSDNAVVTSAQGSLGDWGAAATCDGIVAVRLRSLSDQGASDTQDDLATTGIEFKCADGSVLKTGSEGTEGSWSTWAECPKGGRVAGLKTQIDEVEGEQDQTGLNGLEVVCGVYAAA